MIKTRNEEFYLLIDDSDNYPLTEKEKEHMKQIESQPGYKERMAEAEKNKRGTRYLST